MPRQARTGMDTPAKKAAVPYTMHHCQPHPSPSRLFVDYADFRWHCYRSRFYCPSSSLSLFFMSSLSLFPSSPFSSSFCVKFTFAHQDLFQQQNLRSTRKSLLRTSTVLSPSLFLSLCTGGFSHSILTHFHRIRVPVPVPATLHI